MAGDTFRELGGGDRRIPGPSAVLLCGFSVAEAEQVRTVLDKAQTGTERLILCTEGMLQKHLEEALEGTMEEVPLAPDRLPRVIVLSGMTERQIEPFLETFKASGLPRPIFATATEWNLKRKVRDLLVDLLQEQRALSRSR